MTKLGRSPKPLRQLRDAVADGRLMIANESEVIGFVRERPELARLIAEASEQLRGTIPGAQLRLTLSSDPDYGDRPELFLGVWSQMSEDEALAALRRFDQNWWVHQVARADGLLCIDLEEHEL